MTGAGLTSLKLELIWVPRLDCPGLEGAGEDVVAKQLPWTCNDGSSVHGPRSPDPGGPSYTSAKPSAPKEWWALCAGRTSKLHLVCTCPGGGLPTCSLLP